MAKTYSDMGLYDKALEIFNTYYQSSVKRNLKRAINASLWQKSDVYLRLKDYKNSLKYSKISSTVGLDIMPRLPLSCGFPN